MLLEDMISGIRIELGDKSQTVWTNNDEITRAIVKTVALMSRLTPKRSLVSSALDSGWITGTRILDISTLLPDYIRIEKVEYPADDEPPTIVTWDVVDGYLVFRSDPSLTAGETIRITYLGAWTPPTTDTEGDYPTHLDDIVIIGAAGQSLIFKAEEYTHTVITNLASAVSTLSGISAVTFPSAPDISSYITDADTALDAAIARFAAAVTTLGNMDTPLGDTETALDQVATHLGAAETEYLDVGDDLINAATRGEKAAEIYGQYAGYRTGIANAYIAEAEKRIALALAHEADAARDTTIGNSYVNEAIQRLTIAARQLDSYEQDVSLAASKVAYYRSQIEKATQLGAIANQYLDAAGRYLASGQSKVNEFLVALGYKPEFFAQKSDSTQTPF